MALIHTLWIGRLLPRISENRTFRGGDGGGGENQFPSEGSYISAEDPTYETSLADDISHLSMDDDYTYDTRATGFKSVAFKEAQKRRGCLVDRSTY